MAASNPMRTLYRRLRSVDISRPVVNAVLPSWWDDDAAKSPTAIVELKIQLARVFGLDLKSLLDDEAVIQLKAFQPCQFKLSKSRPDKIRVARAIASSAARVVARATRVPYSGIPDCATLRKEALSGAGSVGFAQLLDVAWARGVPVIHLSELPQGVPKMDGMVLNVGERPVIVLSNQRRRAAWQLFILAHELGHIGRGHLAGGQEVVDEHVDRVEAGEGLESEANAYAIHLLTGNEHTSFHSNGRYVDARSLAAAARMYANERQIDPGHVALNYAHTQQEVFGARPGLTFATANAALEILGDPDAWDLARAKLQQHADLDEVSDDDSEFLLKLTGCT